MTIIETKGLSFHYEKGRDILENINLKIEKGSFTALLGANGCGKTTLMQHFNGLLRPSAGDVLLAGVNLKKLGAKEVCSTIGFVFQNPDDQVFSLTVFDDVAYGVRNLGIEGKELNTRVEEALKLLDIFDLADIEIHKLSYGQKKRVAIAGVMAMRPDVIILDEPTAGLDPMTVSSLMKTLRRLQKEKGITIVISTHEVDLVPINCDYVYVMHKGRILLEGVPDDVFKNKELLRVSNLRLPRIGHLMEVLNEKDKIDIDMSAMTISSARKSIKALVDKLTNK